MPSLEKRENFFGPWTRSESSANIRMTSPKIENMDHPRTAPNSPHQTRANSPPSTPLSSSPPSPHGTLRRNFSSTFMLIPEDRAIDITSTPPKDRFAGPVQYPVSNFRIIFRLVLWWPLFIIGIAQKFLSLILHLAWTPFRLASAPTFWFSAFLWMFWKLIAVPLATIKWGLICLYTPASERNRKKRTILISSGSTIQTLHLARNFYSTGARVVVFEFEGLFGLARFSTSVSKFYTIPKISPNNVNDYISALCDIVEKEKPSMYIPVCATNPAHYDSLAKPHLELLGCSSFIPGAQEVSVLDDILEVMKKCEYHNIPVPPYRALSTKEDLIRLYDSGWMSNFRNVMISTGFHGIIDRVKYILPSYRREFKLTHEISDEKQWIVLRDVPGTHFVTCTTVKDSKVIANVTCSVQPDTRSLIPVLNPEIEGWLKNFFCRVRLQRPINGHISFRFVKSDASGNLLTLGIRVGVSLPYLCYSGVQPRVLHKPCPHFSRQNSGPMVQDGGRYWMPEVVMNTLKHPTLTSFGRLLGTVLDKREALFVYWDPLPYCAFYHFQIPIKTVSRYLQRRQTHTIAGQIIVPVQ